MHCSKKRKRAKTPAFSLALSFICIFRVSMFVALHITNGLKIKNSWEQNSLSEVPM